MRLPEGVSEYKPIPPPPFQVEGDRCTSVLQTPKSIATTCLFYTNLLVLLFLRWQYLYEIDKKNKTKKPTVCYNQHLLVFRPVLYYFGTV